MEKRIEVEEVPGFRAACRAGPAYDAFTDEAFEARFQELEDWLEARDLEPQAWVAAFYGAPEGPPEEGRSEACIAFEGEAASEGDVEVRAEPSARVARLRTTLDRAEDPEAIYDRIYGWIEERGYTAAGAWFVREVYAVNPWKANPRAVEVEFQVPLREGAQDGPIASDRVP